VGEYLNISLDSADDDMVGSCTPCPSGTYMDEGEHTNTECKSYDVSLCQPGYLMVSDRTISSDRVCAPCDAASSQPSEPQFYQSEFSFTGTSCTTVDACDVGERTLVAPSVSRDRECTPCLPGTYQDSNNFEGDSCIVCPEGTWSGEGASKCTAHTVCASNQFESVRGTSATDTVCTSCQAGQYKLSATTYFDTFASQGEGTTCGGSGESFTDYAGETWPIVQAAADILTCGAECAAKNSQTGSTGSVCTAYSVDREEGTCTYYGHSPIVSESQEGSTCYIRDVTPVSCQPCARGTYNSFVNHVNTTCFTVLNCTVGQYAVTDPWPDQNRQCASCTSGSTFQDEENHESSQCKECRNCAAFGLDIQAPCTTTSDAVCLPQAAASIGNGDDAGEAAIWGSGMVVCFVIVSVFFAYLKLKNMRQTQRANKQILELKAKAEDDMHAQMLADSAQAEFRPQLVDGSYVGGAPIYVNMANPDDYFWRYQVPDEKAMFIWYRNNADGKNSMRYQTWTVEGVDVDFFDEMVVAGLGPFPPVSEEWSDVGRNGRIGNAIPLSVNYLPDFVTTVSNMLNDMPDVVVDDEAPIEHVIALAKKYRLPFKSLIEAKIAAFTFSSRETAEVNYDEPRLIRMEDVTFLESVSDVNLRYHEPYATAPGVVGFSEHPNVHKGILDEEYSLETPAIFRVPAHAVGITEINPRELDGKIIEHWSDEEYEDIQKTFAKEMRLAHRFKHTNVLGLVGLVEHPQSPWPNIAVFPWMEFGSLKGVLDEHSGCKPLKDFALLKACREIAQGMEYLTSNAPTGLGYVHRKICARSVLVDATFTMKISDFSGMIRRDAVSSKSSYVDQCMLTGETKGYQSYITVPKVSGKLIKKMDAEEVVNLRDRSFVWPPAAGLTGSPDYAKWVAPEAFGYDWATRQVEPHCVFSEKSDVWSFGITVYEVFTDGAMPYDAVRRDQEFMLDLLTNRKNAADTERKRLDCPRNRDGTTSSFREDVYNLIMYPCWMEDPEERPTFTQLVRDCSELYTRAVKATANNVKARKQRHRASGGDVTYETATDAKNEPRTMARHRNEAHYDEAARGAEYDAATVESDNYFDRVGKTMIEDIAAEALYDFGEDGDDLTMYQALTRNNKPLSAEELYDAAGVDTAGVDNAPLGAEAPYDRGQDVVEAPYDRGMDVVDTPANLRNNGQDEASLYEMADNDGSASRPRIIPKHRRAPKQAVAEQYYDKAEEMYAAEEAVVAAAPAPQAVGESPYDAASERDSFKKAPPAKESPYDQADDKIVSTESPYDQADDRRAPVVTKDSPYDQAGDRRAPVVIKESPYDQADDSWTHMKAAVVESAYDRAAEEVAEPLRMVARRSPAATRAESPYEQAAAEDDSDIRRGSRSSHV